MDVSCSNCNTDYEFDDALVSDAGTSVRCTQCGHRFKVRRRESSSAPEVWIVRTVDGQTLEFRALRELKFAIGGKKVGRDDVLSRGAGRPRRLASIAELEPFFGSTTSEANRARAMTPAGIGPADARGSHFDLAAFVPKADALRSVNVPPPTPEIRSQSRGSARAAEDLAKTEVRETNPFLDEDEVTRSQQYTRELHQLADAGPVSIEPRTEPEPPRFREANGPKTMLGMAPEAIPPSPESLSVTMPFGTPKDATSEDLDGVAFKTKERRSNTLIGLEAEAEAALSGRAVPTAVAKPGGPVKAAEPAKLAAPAIPVPVKPPTPKGPVYAGAAAGNAVKEPSAKPLHKASVPPRKNQTPKPPPAAVDDPDAPPSVGRPNVLPPPPVGPEVKALREPSPMITPLADEPKSSGGRGRPSAYTPTPQSDVWYSLTDDAFEDRRTSAAATSRRASSSSMRLIVALLIGGGLIFVGILVVARFVKKGDNTTDAPTGNIAELLAAADAALRDGDVLTASDRIAEARRVDDNDPKVAKASAKVLVSRAEIAWLELLLIPSGDAGRSAIYRRYQTDVLEAQKQADRAAVLAPGDLEVARIVLDVKRLTGDTAAAGRLKSSVDAISSEPDTQLSIGALDMLYADPATWPAVLAKLAAATAKESQAGRGRALFIYALARANDPVRARKELDELAGLRRPHPLEAALRRFVERIEKGEKIPFRLSDLPTPEASPPANKPDQAAALKAAEDALARRESKKAEALFQEVLTADAENADALIGLAQISKQAGNSKQSLTFLEQAVQKNPDHARALVALADAKWDAGDLTAARPIYKRAVDAGASGPSGERAKQRALAATASTGTDVPIPTTTTTVPTTTTTTTSSPPTTGGGEEPPPFGQDPPPPKNPQPAPQPTNPVPGAPI